MAALNISVKHGQTWDVARANFVKAVSTAEAEYGAYLKEVEWSEDRTSARLGGAGFDVRLTVDLESVHASGHVPFFVRMMEGRLRKFIQHALESP